MKTSDYNDNIARGYAAGNYAAAYKSDHFWTALSQNRAENGGADPDGDPARAEFEHAFTLGYFSSYEMHEIPTADRWRVIAAMNRVGDALRRIGIDF